MRVFYWYLHNDTYSGNYTLDTFRCFSPNTHTRHICCVCFGDFHKLPLWKLQRWWSLVTLGCTQAPRGIWPLVYNEENTNFKHPTLLIIDRFLPLKFHIIITFPSENHCSVCRVIIKTFLVLAEVAMALILWQDVANDYAGPKTNKAPFEVTRQDEISHWANIPGNSSAGQPW